MSTIGRVQYGDNGEFAVVLVFVNIRNPIQSSTSLIWAFMTHMQG